MPNITVSPSVLAYTVFEGYIELSDKLSIVIENNKELLTFNDSFFIEFIEFNNIHDEFCISSENKGKPDGFLLLKVIKQITKLIDVANNIVMNEASKKERELCLI
ncbi:hypothetical protein QPK13_13135 [Photorhabdus tasmaniensis]